MLALPVLVFVTALEWQMIKSVVAHLKMYLSLVLKRFQISQTQMIARQPLFLQMAQAPLLSALQIMLVLGQLFGGQTLPTAMQS